MGWLEESTLYLVNLLVHRIHTDVDFVIQPGMWHRHDPDC